MKLGLSLGALLAAVAAQNIVAAAPQRRPATARKAPPIIKSAPRTRGRGMCLDRLRRRRDISEATLLRDRGDVHLHSVARRMAALRRSIEARA